MVIVTARFPFGDTEAFLEPELEELAQRGHRVRIAPVRPDGRQRPLPAGVSVLRRNLRLALLPAVLHSFAWTGERGIERAAVLLRAWMVASELERDPPDHVHGYWATSSASVAGIVANVLRVPWSFTAHRYDIFEADALERKLAEASATRFVSADGMRLAVARTGLALRPTWTIQPLGVKIAQSEAGILAGADRISEFVAVGRLEPIKGLDVLLEAFAVVASEVPSVRLTVIGSGSCEAALKAQAKQAGVDRLVDFRGSMSHEQVTRYLDKLRGVAIASASRYEGVPVSLMEAMVRGLPAVATSVGGVAELVDESCGFLVESEDSSALAGALLRCLEVEGTELRRLRECARQRVLDRHDARSTAQWFDEITA